jgi:hypothetical protein
MFPRLIVILSIGLLPLPALADTVPEDKILVLACFENLEESTTWEQCVGLMFQPCAGEDVGTKAHVACLEGEQDSWRGTLDTLQADVFDAISTQGATELTDVMGQWTGYVGQKCEEAAASRDGDAASSARLGCQISEIAGLSGEFAACLEGRSTAQYCTYKE